MSAADKAAGSQAYVRLEHVGKRFGDVQAVDDVCLAVERGEIFCLLGGSGCGKTTLLRMLAGFDAPSAGELYIDGQNMADIAPYERPVNMMFQSYALFPHMNVQGNVAFGLEQEGLKRAEIERRVGEILAIVRMEAYARRRPHQLSGGQRQRVALARALVKRPKLLLLDEPLGALDRKLREHTQFELLNIQQQLGVTFIVVTHDQQEAMTLATRIGVMDRGRIVQVGTPRQIYEYPATRFVADFIGAANLFDGVLMEVGPDQARVHCQGLPAPVHISYGSDTYLGPGLADLAAGRLADVARGEAGPAPETHSAGRPGTAVWVAIRPEKIVLQREMLAQTDNWARGTVREIAYLGDTSTFLVVTPEGRALRAAQVNSSRKPDERFGRDEPVYLRWEAGSAVVGTR